MKRKCSPVRGSHLETHQMGECYCNQEQHQSESLKRFKASYQSSVDRYGQVKLAEAVNSVVLDAR